jgi:hypothetical protein
VRIFPKDVVHVKKVALKGALGALPRERVVNVGEKTL